MARDPREVISALRSKTVARGCTPEEAASAKAKADELCEKYGIPKDFGAERPRTEKPQGGTHRSDDGRFWEFKVDPSFTDFANGYDSFFEEMVRRAAEEMARRAAEEMRNRTKGQTKGKHPEKFDSIKDCVEHLFHPRWRRTKDGQQVPLSNADIAILVRKWFPNANTSPESVAWYRSKMRKEGRL